MTPTRNLIIARQRMKRNKINKVRGNTFKRITQIIFAYFYLMIRNVFLFAILLLMSSCFSTKPLIEEAVNSNQEIKITVFSEGDVHTDPNNFCFVSINKADTVFNLICNYKGQKKEKIINRLQLLRLSDFEQKYTNKRHHSALCYDHISIKVGNHSNNFNIPCGTENEFRMLSQ